MVVVKTHFSMPQVCKSMIVVNFFFLISTVLLARVLPMSSHNSAYF